MSVDYEESCFIQQRTNLRASLWSQEELHNTSFCELQSFGFDNNEKSYLKYSIQDDFSFGDQFVIESSRSQGFATVSQNNFKSKSNLQANISHHQKQMLEDPFLVVHKTKPIAKAQKRKSYKEQLSPQLKSIIQRQLYSQGHIGIPQCQVQTKTQQKNRKSMVGIAAELQVSASAVYHVVRQHRKNKEQQKSEQQCIKNIQQNASQATHKATHKQYHKSQQIRNQIAMALKKNSSVQTIKQLVEVMQMQYGLDRNYSKSTIGRHLLKMGYKNKGAVKLATKTIKNKQKIVKQQNINQ